MSCVTVKEPLFTAWRSMLGIVILNALPTTSPSGSLNSNGDASPGTVGNLRAHPGENTSDQARTVSKVRDVFASQHTEKTYRPSPSTKVHLGWAASPPPLESRPPPVENVRAKRSTYCVAAAVKRS
eukprot:661345-Prymnesium_polylepis.1